MNAKNNFINIIFASLVTVIFISVYYNKLQLDGGIVKFKFFKSSIFKSRPLWYADQKNTTENKTKEAEDESKIVLIYTNWYGNPQWLSRSQAIDETGIFYSLETNDFTCPKKCLFTHNLTYLHSADLVVASVVDLKNASRIPKIRPKNQIWAAFICESPINQNIRLHLGYANNLFNWSTSYRLDSDVYWPSGHFYKYKNAEQRNSYFNTRNSGAVPNSTELKQKKMAAWVVSNCHTRSHREAVVSRLKKFIDIDIYGKCGDYKCPKEGDCRAYLSSNYKFYLSFENSLCLDYVTEKFFDAFDHSLIPITYGLGYYPKLAPTHSYINMLDYDSPKELADYLHFLSQNVSEYLKYFEWKQNYTVLNDPTSSGLCNLCVHLWGNGDVQKHYPDFSKWWENKPLGNKMTTLQEKYLKNTNGVCVDNWRR